MTGEGFVTDPDFGKRDSSREPDALIDEKLFGHKVDWRMCGNRQTPYRTGGHDFGMPFSVPYYYSDIKDAWEIVEEFRKRGITLIIGSREDLDPSQREGYYCDDLLALKDEKYRVQRWNKDNQRYDPAVYAKTAPEAICKAVFQILGITESNAK